MERILDAFGVLGCVELFAALVVAVGCAGELWLLINKLTLHVEPISRSSSRFWRVLAWVDFKARPFLVRLKIKGRKLPEAKEQLLERVFVIFVALGVAIEFLALPISMKEIADLNDEAGAARKEAGEANSIAALSNERSKHLESTNLVLRTELAKLQTAVEWRTITPKQESILIDLLTPVVKANFMFRNRVVIDVEQTDFEARWFAKRIADVLTKCGFEVGFNPMIGFSDPKQPIPLGFGVFVRSGQQNTPGNAILAALHSIGHVPAVASETLGFPSDVVTIRVWHKAEK